MLAEKKKIYTLESNCFWKKKEREKREQASAEGAKGEKGKQNFMLACTAKCL